MKEGAQLFQPACKLPTKGFYFRPTLLSGVSMSHRVQGGDFRPVPASSFPDARRGRREGEQHPYGLSAGVWTDKGRILESTELKAGVVGHHNKFDPTSPFGGYKESGFGRGGAPRPARLLQARLMTSR